MKRGTKTRKQASSSKKSAESTKRKGKRATDAPPQDSCNLPSYDEITKNPPKYDCASPATTSPLDLEPVLPEPPMVPEVFEKSKGPHNKTPDKTCKSTKPTAKFDIHPQESEQAKEDEKEEEEDWKMLARVLYLDSAHQLWLDWRNGTKTTQDLWDMGQEKAVGWWNQAKEKWTQACDRLNQTQHLQESGMTFGQHFFQTLLLALVCLVYVVQILIHACVPMYLVDVEHRFQSTLSSYAHTKPLIKDSGQPLHDYTREDSAPVLGSHRKKTE